MLVLVVFIFFSPFSGLNAELALLEIDLAIWVAGMFDNSFNERLGRISNATLRAALWNMSLNSSSLSAAASSAKGNMTRPAAIR